MTVGAAAGDPALTPAARQVRQAAPRQAPRHLREWRCVDTSGGILDVPLPECQSVGGTPGKGRLPRAPVGAGAAAADAQARRDLRVSVTAPPRLAPEMAAKALASLEPRPALATRNPDIFMTSAQVAALRRGRAASRGGRGVAPSAVVAELRRAFPTQPRGGGSEAAPPTGGSGRVAIVSPPEDAETPIHPATIQGASVAPAAAPGQTPSRKTRARDPEETCVWDPHLLALSRGACRALGGAPARAPFDAHLKRLPPTGAMAPPRAGPEAGLWARSPRWRQLGMAR